MDLIVHTSSGEKIICIGNIGTTSELVVFAKPRKSSASLRAVRLPSGTRVIQPFGKDTIKTTIKQEQWWVVRNFRWEKTVGMGRTSDGRAITVYCSDPLPLLLPVRNIRKAI